LRENDLAAVHGRADDRPARDEEHDKVLEIGTGCGYQTAILAELAEQVFSVEIIEALTREGELRLRATGCDNVQLRIGEGSHGRAEHAPFHKIMVTAAPKMVLPALATAKPAAPKPAVQLPAVSTAPPTPSTA
jgi:protein-L-isoaspartate(D-aspartate) O-methyltransferase